MGFTFGGKTGSRQRRRPNATVRHALFCSPLMLLTTPPLLFLLSDYLFGSALEMKKLGIDASRAPADPLPPQVNSSHSEEPTAKKARSSIKLSGKIPTAVVLDIEGTVAPISFVADVMFPYARKHVRKFLEETYETKEASDDVALIRKQAAEDGITIPAPQPGGSNKAEVVAAVVSWIEDAIDKDRKVMALKNIQGHVWRRGFEMGEMKAELYRDVPDSLTELRRAGIKSYIYSSGSREAQRLFFGFSQVGDLRPYLCGFFDTTSGPKGEAGSYREIALSLGVSSPSELLFATDVYAEAVAAREAGWEAVLVVRPGNKPLPEGASHEFRVIESLKDLIV